MSTNQQVLSTGQVIAEPDTTPQVPAAGAGVRMRPSARMGTLTVASQSGPSGGHGRKCLRLGHRHQHPTVRVRTARIVSTPQDRPLNRAWANPGSIPPRQTGSRFPLARDEQPR